MRDGNFLFGSSLCAQNTHFSIRLLLLLPLCCIKKISLPYLSMSKLLHLLGRPSTSLFAHHVNKKITKKMMYNRPKKHRQSDIHRNNVNFGKCITKIENAPSDFIVVSEDGEFWRREIVEDVFLIYIAYMIYYFCYIYVIILPCRILESAGR